ncbi:MAG: hypothetical protein ACI4M9_01685, partial [Succinivibrio sp.]
SREVEIFSIDLLSLDEDSFTIEVYCSKGTYIRTLVADIGEELGCGAHVTMLRRIEVDGLPKGTMHTMEFLQELADKREDITDFSELDKYLIPIDKAMSYLPLVEIPKDMAVTLCQGMRQTDLNRCTIPDTIKDDEVFQIRTDGLFIGVGHIHKGVLISDRMMSDPLHTNKGLYR